MKRKSLLGLYRLKEDTSVDDFNKALRSGPSTSLVKPNGAKPRVGTDAASQKAQADLDQSKSVFDEAAGGTIALNLADEELRTIKRWAGEFREDPGAEEILKKIEDAEGDGGGKTPFSSSMSSTKSYGSVGMK